MHRVDGLDDAVSMRSDGPADRDHDAELGGAGGACGVRGFEHLVELEERVDVDVGASSGPTASRTRSPPGTHPISR